MQKTYVIQDTQSKEYYYQGYANEGFTLELSEATQYKSEEEALAELELQVGWRTMLFESRFIQIRSFYKIG